MVYVASFWHAERVNGDLEILESNTDVTLRKQAEEAKSELASMIESSEDAILSKDMDGTIRTWNAAAERLLGYSANEIIGRRITLLIAPERAPEEQQILDRLRRGERIRHYQTVAVAKDGRRIDVSTTVSPVIGGNGRVIGASASVRDITELVRSQEALRKSEERYRLLAIASAQVVWTTGAHGEVIEDIPTWNRYTGLIRLLGRRFLALG